MQIAPRLKKRAHELYVHNPELSIAAIATMLGMTGATFRRYREAWGWPPRREALAAARQKKEAAGSDAAKGEEMILVPSSRAAPNLRDAALSLVQITQSRIDELIAKHSAGQAQDHDKTAKILADYAKTLTTAQALLKHETTKRDEVACDDEDSRSIHELRDELGRHLERLVAEEETRRSNEGVVQG
ncbi:hypothetical protein AB4072_02005 [Microvirga sp. 2MCAF38]|uniref:hypothetical protein n=1 Tax=Microvirga sp. 2MCAF38 TaxID=3232989 RepID=UPI003F96B0E6